MELRDLLDNVVESDNVTKFKEEFCEGLKKVDNDTFMRIFYALNLSNLAFDDCDCGCCDCDDCGCDCDCE